MTARGMSSKTKFVALVCAVAAVALVSISIAKQKKDTTETSAKESETSKSSGNDEMIKGKQVGTQDTENDMVTNGCGKVINREGGLKNVEEDDSKIQQQQEHENEETEQDQETEEGREKEEKDTYIIIEEDEKNLEEESSIQLQQENENEETGQESEEEKGKQKDQENEEKNATDINGHNSCKPLQQAVSMITQEVKDSHRELLAALAENNISEFKNLVEKHPIILEMKEFRGNDVLHLACRQEDIQLEIVQLIIEKFPVAVDATDRLRSTPLHTAIANHASPDIVSLLIENGPQAISVPDRDGATPVHLAVCWDIESNLIRRMIQLNSSAATIIDDNGRTLLGEACYQGIEGDILEMLLERWPVACLLVDEYDKSPLENALRKQRGNAHFIKCITDSSKDAACALVECLLQSDRVPTRIMQHVEQIMIKALPKLKDTIYDTFSLVVAQMLRSSLSQFVLRKLFWHNELQVLLKNDKNFQHMINGIYHMNAAGRDYIIHDPGNKLQGVKVLQAVSSNVNALFWHLRESPSLFA